MAYAEAEFRLSKKEGGATVRDHLLSAEMQTGEWIEELHPEPPSFEFAYLWRWFCELSATRATGFAGPLRITYQEIKTWSELTQSAVSLFELEMITKMDRVFIDVAYEKASDG